MINKYILPVSYPIITSWQWHATIFSILGKNNYALQWIYSNYIQLIAFKKKDFLFLDILPGGEAFEQCPYLSVKMIIKKDIMKYSYNILDFLISSIRKNYYIYGIFDESFILKKDNKFAHELMIYGYDYDTKQFFVGDFTFKNKYSYQNVFFEDIVQGFENIQNNDDFLFYQKFKGNRGLYLISLDLNEIKYKLNKELIIKNINEYISYKNIDCSQVLDNDIDKPILGIFSIYKALLNQISEEKNKYDIRAFHVFYDHKVLMFERIKFLIENNYIDSNHILELLFKDIMYNSLIIRNKILKFNLSSDNKIIFQIKDKLKRLELQEYKALSYLVQNM